METKDLAKVPVEFDEVEHKYTLNGRNLRGITWIVQEYVLPDRGDFIEKMKSGARTSAILEAATKRGHETHSQVQMIVDGFGYENPFPEVRDFFKKMHDVRFIASEYLVSDMHHFASAIDIIDSDLNLYDIKTTSKLDTKYLSWQLSIYAFLFELNNPSLNVGELYGVWLRNGVARVVRVDRIPNDVIADLLYAAADGLPWSNPYEKLAFLEPKEVSEVLKLERRMAQVETTYKKLQAEEAAMKERVRELMLARNIVKWTSPSGALTFTLRQPTTRTTYTLTEFMKKYPNITEAVFERYPKILGMVRKESSVKATLTIKTNSDENDNRDKERGE